MRSFDETFAPEATLAQLGEHLPTPFYLYDEAGIRASCRALREAFAWNPGFRQYFAVKATPNAAILRILREEGMDVVCSSAPELLLAERCGFQGDEILFAPNYPLPADIAQAARLQTGVILDGDCLLEAFRQGNCLPETLGLRYNPGGEFCLGDTKISRPERMKFGFSREQIFAAIPALQAAGVRRLGLHGYLCGNVQQPGYYAALAQLLFPLAVEIAEKTGMEIAFLDLSGGLGISYRPEDPMPDLQQQAQEVRQAYADILQPAGLGTASIYTELGRYLLGPHGILLSRVLYRKQLYGTSYLGVDACAANLMRPMLYGAYHHISVVGKAACTQRLPYEVVGSVAENTDKFTPEPRLLPQVEVGDLLAFHDVGAHGHSMGYQYGGKLRSAEYLYQCDGSIRLIRRAETPEDYLATLEGL